MNTIINDPMTMEKLLADIERFCKEYGITEAQLGKEAIKSHPAIRWWRDGKLVPKLDTVERLYAWMIAHERQARRQKLLSLFE